MIFNSKRVNTDPWPYVWSGHSRINKERTDIDFFRAGAGPKMVERFNYEYAPRMEFNNNPNPLLVWFRAAAANGVRAHHVDLNYAEYNGSKPEHVEHARKVLARLEYQEINAEGGEL